MVKYYISLLFFVISFFYLHCIYAISVSLYIVFWVPFYIALDYTTLEETEACDAFERCKELLYVWIIEEYIE